MKRKTHYNKKDDKARDEQRSYICLITDEDYVNNILHIFRIYVQLTFIQMKITSTMLMILKLPKYLQRE